MYKFSLIIPSYNIKSFSKEFFKTMKYISSNVDVIFVNDFSTDDTKELIENFIKDKPNMRLFNNKKNMGPGGAINNGISRMKTKWYFRLDPDDIIHENYEEEITKAIDENPDAKLIRYKFMFNTPKGIQKPNVLESLYFTMAFGWSCGFNVEKFGKPVYKSNFKMEDMEMFGRQYVKTKDSEIFIDKSLVSYTTNREDSTMNTIDLNTLENWKYAFKVYKGNKHIKGLKTYLYKLNIHKRILSFSKVHEIRPAWMKLMYHAFVKHFIKTKKIIIFASFDNSTEGVNEIAVFNEMYKRYSKDYKFIWLANTNKGNLPKDVEVFHPNSFGAMRAAAAASYFISGTYTKIPNLKRKVNVTYLNHGYNVKTMGHDWVDEVKSVKRLIRRIMHNNQIKQIDNCFVYDEYDKQYMSRVFKHKFGKKTKFIINGFPNIQEHKKGNDVLFLPSWHETKEVIFPELKNDKLFVSFHPRTTNVFPPENWTLIKGKARESIEAKYIFSDNSSAPIEYIKSGIQVYWIKGDYDRKVCKEFKEKYSKLIIEPNDFKPLSSKEYSEIVKDIIDAPTNKEAVKITIDAMEIK